MSTSVGSGEVGTSAPGGVSGVVLHAQWSAGRLWIWGEDAARIETHAGGTHDAESHPFGCEAARVSAALRSIVGEAAGIELETGSLRLALPAHEHRDGRWHPAPSPALAHTLGLDADEAETEEAGGSEVRSDVPAMVRVFASAAVSIAPSDVERVLDGLMRARLTALTGAFGAERGWEGPHVGPGAVYFAAALRLVRHVMSQQRLVPMLRQSASGELRGLWMPWLSDEATAARASALVNSMPAAARAAVDSFEHDPWKISEEFLTVMTDTLCRRVLETQDFFDAVREKSDADPHVAWLRGLLSGADGVSVAELSKAGLGRQDLPRRIRTWIGGLEERGASSAWRLLLRLHEPGDPLLAAASAEASKGKKAKGAKGAPAPASGEPEWTVTFQLQSLDKLSLELDARDIWALPTESITLEGRRLDGPQELLLAELGRASRIYPKLESALEESKPVELKLSTKQAYEFLREHRPILQEQGFGVDVPAWWDSPLARLGARLRIESDAGDPTMARSAGAGASVAGPQIGMGSLVKYKWEIAIGDTTISLHEFEQLAARKSPLVQINGRWVEIRPEDVQAAIKFIQSNPGGEIRLIEALRLAYGTDSKKTGIAVVGLEATGWAAAFINAEASPQSLSILEPPATFHGTLRPYQVRGMSWLAFLDRLGLGACLADDMGLGKTIQLLALLAWEREDFESKVRAGQIDRAQKPAPTLLVVPMSVLGNWAHETRRFCPELKVVLHHGVERAQGDAFVEQAAASDMVVTTYALAHRDQEALKRVRWRRIVLDEAQYIKNPQAKQSLAVRSLDAGSRVALTGTPVENRLSELWSILDFLNPGYLGGAAAFRQGFSVPIERHRDKSRSDALRGLVRPFLLRRVKTDPNVVADLPEKLESREYTHLTSEQAQLYEACVKRMLAEVEQSEGIQRRGLVLSGLIKLKQICNHPSQLLKDHEEHPTRPVEIGRSGKCVRLVEMLDTVIAAGDQALVFTQFRQMGHILQHVLRQRLDREILFLHGGTSQRQREQIVQQFQKADGSSPILLLSLKAGGVGLNLTAATHVFHFDRWWNPAVESQATDRAYRIGQTRTVQVHKFVVRGTLEERIDQMIESKTELAQNIIGDGEAWLTELSTEQLRDILTLRNDAVGDEI
ncbi:MAG: DEAD/DEAH box helicase [Planctomycetota bacterium]|nr:DEAD/DEAH box helicase [Planctomycetota bacterium]